MYHNLICFSEKKKKVYADGTNKFSVPNDGTINFFLSHEIVQI